MPVPDHTASALIDLLEAEGAGAMRHAAGRSLLEHLLETFAIARRWGQPEWLAHAALMHSVYGTDRYRQQLLPLDSRGRVRELAGEQAERIAYLFSVVPRGPLLAGTYRWASPSLLGLAGEPSRDELDALVLLHMVNMAEQARLADGSPDAWLRSVRSFGELLLDSSAVELPDFLAKLAGFSHEDEALVGRAYRSGLAGAEPIERRANRLALAASACPVIPEPCVWLAYIAHCRGDMESVVEWARCALQRLLSLGAAWDKRLTFEQWRELVEVLAGSDGGFGSANVAHPRELFEVVVNGSGRTRAGTGREASNSLPAGTERFLQYALTLTEGSSGQIYPHLPSRPWFDPSEFHLADYLQSYFPAIREEILSLDPAIFHRETERIQRVGDWDVAFFYERGRRHHEICEACPVTTAGIESHGAITTMAGLAYVSRLRAGTHISAHRGPTNLRLRCHLGIQVPEGDCAIRVGEETRRWEQGRCLVFDDHFEHEAWNRTDADRIVLIVDLWHPGLSSTEIRLLEGLHGYASAQARRLNRYWAANAAAAGERG